MRRENGVRVNSVPLDALFRLREQGGKRAVIAKGRKIMDLKKAAHMGRLSNWGMAFAELNTLEQLEYVLRLGVSLRKHRHC